MNSPTPRQFIGAYLARAGDREWNRRHDEDGRTFIARSRAEAAELGFSHVEVVSRLPCIAEIVPLRRAPQSDGAA